MILVASLVRFSDIFDNPTPKPKIEHGRKQVGVPRQFGWVAVEAGARSKTIAGPLYRSGRSMTVLQLSFVCVANGFLASGP